MPGLRDPGAVRRHARRPQGCVDSGLLTAGLAVAATAFSLVELGGALDDRCDRRVVFVTSWPSAIGILLGGRLRRPECLADRTVVPEPPPGGDGTQPDLDDGTPVDLVRCRHAFPAQNLASLPVALERPVNDQ